MVADAGSHDPDPDPSIENTCIRSDPQSLFTGRIPITIFLCWDMDLFLGWIWIRIFFSWVRSESVLFGGSDPEPVDINPDPKLNSILSQSTYGLY